MGRKKLTAWQKIQRNAREIGKRLYKTSYQLVLGFLAVTIVQAPDLLGSWDVYEAAAKANPALVVVVTGIISVLDNAIRTANDKLKL